MLGYYIHVDLTKDLGVNKKVSYQIEELKKVSEVREIVLETNNSFLLKLFCVLPLVYPCRYNYEKALTQIDNPSYIYIRKNMFLDKYFVSFLSKLKSKFPTCKVIFEIPTFPYLREYLISLKLIPLIYKEIYYSFFCKRYIDRIVTYSPHNKIFNIKTIPIMNGVDFSAFKVKLPSPLDDVITMIAVSMCAPWHGYERIIKGLYEYKLNGGTRKIRFLLVGDGKELLFYKKLVKQFSLENYVVFAGIQNGESLETLYNEADLGLGSFGFYKIGLSLGSSLKTREYLCKGLPVISGCKQDLFLKYPCDFHLEFTNDNSVVDINVIIAFYDHLFQSGSNKNLIKLQLIDNIREYAYRHVSMESTYSPVLSFITENLEVK